MQSIQNAYTDILLSDFSDPLFQAAFQTYFAELGITVRDWDGLFAEINGEGGNKAFVRTANDGSIVGFLMLKPIPFTSWFFTETCGFIREFWVAKAFRGQGHGTALLQKAEDYFRTQEIYTAILTTHTAADFYQKNGYRKAPACKAKNSEDVLIKSL